MRFFVLLVVLFFVHAISAQITGSTKLWHNKERELRYHPEGKDIIIVNGKRRFTRALYGTNTAFRVEAGDLPEFAMYMPGMGGTIKFGLHRNNTSKWLIDADSITARYRAGSMIYEIRDRLLGKGKLHVVVLALAEREGVIIKITAENISGDVSLSCMYGGATGKKFSRDGDMGPDPESSFYLKPEYCTDNRYSVANNLFTLRYGTGEVLSEEDRYENKNLPGDKVRPMKGKEQIMTGLYPPAINLRIVNAAAQESPITMINSAASATPAIAGIVQLKNRDSLFFNFMPPVTAATGIDYENLPLVFVAAENARRKIADRIEVNTPDPFINTIGGALSVAADAIWEEPSYLHGAIGWRMRLNGWRGAYAGDVLGWHDRARQHFRAYANSQVLAPDTGKIVADTALHLARQLEKMGTAVFSNGYISRNPNDNTKPHHYDMNLVYIDELLWHIRWTGDTAFVKEIWPVIKRHLAWEKRNFDKDDDGLYDAYAAIWASDGLQYSGGAGTHTSAYNYRANKMAAELATLIGDDAKPYQDEAAKIAATVNAKLWMKEKGWYAEFKDTMGLKLLHPSPALWTLYHAIDGGLPDVFKAYQSLQYIDNHIPHIPVKAKGLTGNYYTISTSNWMPYTWSLNNVVLAELMHTSLANWQSGRNEEAFTLWKSALLESMYLGGSPGNFQQISTYDAVRGEAYRDFADPVGMTARSLVQGLFGILPDAIHNTIAIQPGLPAAWKYASLKTPDIKFVFNRNKNVDTYKIVPSFRKKMQLVLLLKAKCLSIGSVFVNNKKVQWRNVDSAVGLPMIKINAGAADHYQVTIHWMGTDLSDAVRKTNTIVNGEVRLGFANLQVKEVYDPQQALQTYAINRNIVTGETSGSAGLKTIFVRITEGQFIYWKPILLDIKPAVEIIAADQQESNRIGYLLKNNSSQTFTGSIWVNGTEVSVEKLLPGASKLFLQENASIVPGSNEVKYVFYPFVNDKQAMLSRYAPRMAIATVVNWNVSAQTKAKPDHINLSAYFNDKVTNIFKQQYLSPRPNTATLQIPTQGIGEWTHPMLTAVINDSGLRKAAIAGNISVKKDISFQTPAAFNEMNIIFTSQWDNYPKQLAVPLTGKASHVYLLMAGSTNTMQSRITNGIVRIVYTDGTSDSLLLENPANWWPIEQDYYEDGFAFKTGAPHPIRLHLKTGKTILPFGNDADTFNGKMIDGGAANILDMALDKNKTLQSLTLETRANDVVIGLMAVTLMR